MEKKGTVYFFTGLAGAGKTTIGGLFYQRLKEKWPDTVLIDGDQARTQAGPSSRCWQKSHFTIRVRSGVIAGTP